MYIYHFWSILKIFRCLKVHFKKTYTFSELGQLAVAAAARMIFSQKKSISKNLTSILIYLKKKLKNK